MSQPAARIRDEPQAGRGTRGAPAHLRWPVVSWPPCRATSSNAWCSWRRTASWMSPMTTSRTGGQDQAVVAGRKGRPVRLSPWRAAPLAWPGTETGQEAENQHMRPWVSRMVGAVAAVSAVACAGAAAAPAAASAATPDYWRVVHRVSMPKSNIVAAVSADSAKDAWAVGALDQATPGYVLHWNGLRWRRVTTPELLRPSGVIAISPANVWLI